MSRKDLIELRGGTAAAWTSANPVLAAREPGLETDTRKVKYGDGTTAWVDLPYAAGGGTELPTAKFTGTGSGVTDGIDFPLDVAVREGTTLPSWIQLVGNLITFTEAGLYVASTLASPIVAHFPTTVPADPDGEVSLYVEGHLTDVGTWTGSDYFHTGASAADLNVNGEVNFNIQTNIQAGYELVLIGNGSAKEGDGVTPITDGTFDITGNFVITRLTPGAMA